MKQIIMIMLVAFIFGCMEPKAEESKFRKLEDTHSIRKLDEKGFGFDGIIYIWCIDGYKYVVYDGAECCGLQQMKKMSHGNQYLVPCE